MYLRALSRIFSILFICLAEVHVKYQTDGQQLKYAKMNDWTIVLWVLDSMK